MKMMMMKGGKEMDDMSTEDAATMMKAGAAMMMAGCMSLEKTMTGMAKAKSKNIFKKKKKHAH